MWGLSNLEVLGLGFLLIVLGFGLGVAYWEYMRDIRPMLKELEDDRVSNNVSGLRVRSGTGGLSGAVGFGGGWADHPSTGGEDHLDHRGVDSDTVPGKDAARTGS